MTALSFALSSRAADARRRARTSLVWILVAASGACVSTATPSAHGPTAIPSATVACVGSLSAPPAGARQVEDPTLRASAVGAATEGKLCTAVVYEATAPLRVYRVWQRDRAYTQLGRWWSLERPQGPRERYRSDNVICPEWSALDVVSECDIRVGAHFAMGPGQSARCRDGSTLPASPTLQVYLDNDARQGDAHVYVEHCRELGAFP